MKPGPKPTQWEQRFLAKIDAYGGDDECWLWTGHRLPNGYGQFTMPDGSKHYSHRLIYEMMVGPIPKGLGIRHSCDNPPCCNPAHLLVGTQQDNLDDMVARGRSNKGRRHWNVRLTIEQVAAIRADTRPSTVVAPEYDVGARQIRKIRQRTKWR